MGAHVIISLPDLGTLVHDDIVAEGLSRSYGWKNRLRNSVRIARGCRCKRQRDLPFVQP